MVRRLSRRPMPGASPVFATATLVFTALLLPLASTGVAQQQEPASVTPPAAADDIAELAREVVSARRFQTELAEPAATVERPPPRRRRPLRLPVDWLMAALALLVAAALLWTVLDVIRRRRCRTGAVNLPAEVDPTDGDGVGRLRTSADRLAAAGRFGEAIHQLLLLAVEYLNASRTPPPPTSLTSRELLHLAPAPVHLPMRELVLDVELSLFGGMAADATAYARNRARFDLLARVFA